MAKVAKKSANFTFVQRKCDGTCARTTFESKVYFIVQFRLLKFLAASEQLYTWPCRSVGRSVGRSVCLSVCLSVGRSVYLSLKFPLSGEPLPLGRGSCFAHLQCFTPNHIVLTRFYCTNFRLLQTGLNLPVAVTSFATSVPFTSLTMMVQMENLWCHFVLNVNYCLSVGSDICSQLIYDALC